MMSKWKVNSKKANSTKKSKAMNKIDGFLLIQFLDRFRLLIQKLHFTHEIGQSPFAPKRLTSSKCISSIKHNVRYDTTQLMSWLSGQLAGAPWMKNMANDNHTLICAMIILICSWMPDQNFAITNVSGDKCAWLYRRSYQEVSHCRRYELGDECVKISLNGLHWSTA